MSPHKAARLRRNIVLYVVAALVLLIWAVPILWAVIVSLKSEAEVLA